MTELATPIRPSSSYFDWYVVDEQGDRSTCGVCGAPLHWQKVRKGGRVTLVSLDLNSLEVWGPGEGEVAQVHGPHCNHPIPKPQERRKPIEF